MRIKCEMLLTEKQKTNKPKEKKKKTFENKHTIQILVAIGLVDEETEAPENYVTCSRSHDWKLPEQVNWCCH